MGTTKSLPLRSGSERPIDIPETNPRGPEALGNSHQPSTSTLTLPSNPVAWLAQQVASVGQLPESIQYTSPPPLNITKTEQLSEHSMRNFLVIGVAAALAAPTQRIAAGISAVSQERANDKELSLYSETAVLNNIRNGAFVASGVLELNKGAINGGSESQAVKQTTNENKVALTEPAKHATRGQSFASFAQGKALKPRKSLDLRSNLLETLLPLTTWKMNYAEINRQYFGNFLFLRANELFEILQEILQYVSSLDSSAIEEKPFTLKALRMFVRDNRLQSLLRQLNQQEKLQSLKASENTSIIINSILEILEPSSSLAKNSSIEELLQKQIGNLRAIDPDRFNYSVGKTNIAVSSSEEGFGVITTEWIPTNTTKASVGCTTARVPAHILAGPLPKSRQAWFADNVELFYLQGQTLSIIEQPINCENTKINQFSLDAIVKFEGVEPTQETNLIVEFACENFITRKTRFVRIGHIVAKAEQTRLTIRETDVVEREEYSAIDRLALTDSLRLVVYCSESGLLQFKDVRLTISFGQRTKSKTAENQKLALKWSENGVIQRQSTENSSFPLIESMTLEKDLLVESVKVRFDAKAEEKRGSVLLRVWEEDGAISDINLNYGKLSDNWISYSQDSTFNPPISFRAIQLMGTTNQETVNTLWLRNISIGVTTSATIKYQLKNEQITLERRYSYDEVQPRDDDRSVRQGEELTSQPIVQQTVVFEAKHVTSELAATHEVPLNADRILVKSDFSSVNISYRAKGRGKVELIVLKANKKDTKKINVSKGMTTESELEYVFQAEASACGIETGDELVLKYSSEGNFELIDLKCSLLTKTVVHQLKFRKFYSDLPNHDRIPLTKNKIYCGWNQVERVVIDFDGKDQGWGNQKGWVSLRIQHPNGQFYDHWFHERAMEHTSQHYSFTLDNIREFTSPMCTIGFRGVVGGGGGHELYINNFVARIYQSNKVPTRSLVFEAENWQGPQEIIVASGIDLIEVEAECAREVASPVNLQIQTSESDRRQIQIIRAGEVQESFPKTISVGEVGTIAIGDKIRLCRPNQAPNYSDFRKLKLRIRYLPLTVPNHRVIACQFSNGHWKETNIDSSNLLGGKHELKHKLLAVSASCTWKTPSKDEASAAALSLVVRRSGQLLLSANLFGNAPNQWTRTFTSFDSTSEIVRHAERGDEICLQRSAGSQLFVQDLEIVLICEEPEDS